MIGTLVCLGIVGAIVGAFGMLWHARESDNHPNRYRTRRQLRRWWAGMLASTLLLCGGGTVFITGMNMDSNRLLQEEREKCAAVAKGERYKIVSPGQGPDECWVNRHDTWERDIDGG